MTEKTKTYPVTRGIGFGFFMLGLLAGLALATPTPPSNPAAGPNSKSYWGKAYYKDIPLEMLKRTI